MACETQIDIRIFLSNTKSPGNYGILFTNI